METLLVHRAKINQYQIEKWNGADWLVAPVIGLVPGVVNRELVLPDELSAYTDVWSDCPVTVNHPTDAAGGYISARSRTALARFQTGRLYDARFEEDRLKGSVWINLDRLNEFGQAGYTIREKIESGEGLEVSTGYYRDVEHTKGVYKGKPYDTIARNIRPDHLALLPNDKGACSWEDGCGVPRVNKESNMTKSQQSMTGDDGTPRINRSFFETVVTGLAAALGINQESEQVPETIAANQRMPITVSFFLEENAARSLALTPGDLPPESMIVGPESMSVPLVSFFAEDMSDDEATGFVGGELVYISRGTPVVLTEVTGIGRQITGGDLDILYLTLGSENIQRMAYNLADYLRWWAEEFDDEEGVTVEVMPTNLVLGYIPRDAESPVISLPGGKIAFSHMGYTMGDTTVVFELAGELRANAEGANFKDFSNVVAARKGELLSAAEKGETDEMKDRRQIIEALAANADCGCDRNSLEAMSTDELGALAETVLVNGELDGLLTIPMPTGNADADSAPVVPAEDATPPVDTEPAAVEESDEPAANAGDEPAADVPEEGAPEDGEPAGEPVANAEDESGEPAAETPVANEQQSEPAPAPAPAAPAINAALAELVAMVESMGGVDAVRETLQAARSQVDSERNDLISALVANPRCQFTSNALQEFTTENLRLLNQSLEPVDFSATPFPTGRVPATNGAVTEIPMPSL